MPNSDVITNCCLQKNLLIAILTAQEGKSPQAQVLWLIFIKQIWGFVVMFEGSHYLSPFNKQIENKIVTRRRRENIIRVWSKTLNIFYHFLHCIPIWIIPYMSLTDHEERGDF